MPERTPSQKENPITPEKIEELNLSEKEKASRNADIMLMQGMRQDRDQPHPELDGMTYVQYYEANRKKDLAYLPPKKNKQDVRISSGITREKDTTMLATMLSMNFQPDITAFDKDNLMVAELGTNMADLVKKSREIENWQKKRPIIYRELIAQGDVFVQEIKVDEFRDVPLDRVEWNPLEDKISEFSFKSRLKKIFSGCSVRMINGKKIFLGNIRTEYITDQSDVAVLNIYRRNEAWARYGQWERWKNIPTAVESIQFDQDGLTYKDWNIVPLNNKDQIAEVMLYRVKENRFQIYLNGIPMLPHNFPLTAIYPSGDLLISQGKYEPISDFAYSKGQPAKTKVEEEVLNEATTLMIEGMRQGRKPPMGSRTNKVFGAEVFRAGKITPDLPAGELHSILPQPGLTPADFSFYQLIKTAIQDKTVQDSYEGKEKPGGAPTATQVERDREQQMLKLGSALDGVINLERQLTWNRIQGILTYWTQKVDPNLGAVQEGIMGEYRKVSVGTTLEEGQRGTKIFRFTDEEFPTVGNQAREERDLSKQYGQDVRIVYMNPDALRNLKFTWYVVVLPTPAEGSVETHEAFKQNISDAIALFGMEALNIEYAKQRFAINIREPYSKFFASMPVQSMLPKLQEDPATRTAAGLDKGRAPLQPAR